MRHQRNALFAVVAAALTIGAVAACEPRDDTGLNAIGVAVTTDRVSTRALEKGGIDVRWMTCNADVKGKHTSGPSQDAKASVHCRGKTDDDRTIKVSGTVTYERKNICVRGDLTAKVDGHQVFQANVIGDCNARKTTHPRPSGHTTHPWDRRTTAGSDK
ncbi:hypothetical protein SAZ11_38465 [Streptomyces sp. FXJ1.4098]|uniref:hypothetical protein n=1 Tax=Streptomyces sp. NPDC020845 TaxID=3365096 RepID=UPI002992ABEF|nr:hypothetical protein [Streptomyces sp. FXJ1.4098]